MDVEQVCRRCDLANEHHIVARELGWEVQPVMHFADAWNHDQTANVMK